MNTVNPAMNPIDGDHLILTPTCNQGTLERVRLGVRRYDSEVIINDDLHLSIISNPLQYFNSK